MDLFVDYLRAFWLRVLSIIDFSSIGRNKLARLNLNLSLSFSHIVQWQLCLRLVP